MKKLFILVALFFLGQNLMMAQKDISVSEANVPAKYVKDFQNQAKNAQHVSWFMAEDSSAYMATYTTADGDKEALRFTPKSTETRYYVEEKYYPHAIKDSVHNLYPKHSISCVYIRNIRNKSTYQARIVQRKGFLFWKKETNVKVLSFETTGKMIEAIDEQ